MGGAKILIVDDDPDIVEYLRTFLKDTGYEVVSANAASSAHAELEKTTVDLVILDVLMPGRSGLDFLVTLRKDERWSELPVVVLTGSDRVLKDRGRSYHALEADMRGADGVLGKPLNPQELLRTLDRLGVKAAEARP